MSQYFIATEKVRQPTRLNVVFGEHVEVEEADHGSGKAHSEIETTTRKNVVSLVIRDRPFKPGDKILLRVRAASPKPGVLNVTGR